MSEAVRWTIKVSRETDLALRKRVADQLAAAARKYR